MEFSLTWKKWNFQSRVTVVFFVATLPLGSRPRQGLVKVRAKSQTQESHFMLSGVWERVREWTPTLPSELPFWELESQWTPESSKGDCKGQNSLDWKVPYIIENLLEHRFQKWACMTHLRTYNTSYGQKKGRESNYQFDSRPLKAKIHPDSLACKWRATYHWKTLNKGYNFALNLTSIKGMHIKLWASRIVGVSIFGISGLPFGNPGTKWHLGASPMTMHKIYYKGEGGGFPQVQAVLSHVSLCLPVAHPCTKSATAMH